MELDPSTINQREMYKLMIGGIVPRPIAWVSTLNREGIRNLAPFSFFNGVSSSPPALSIAFSHTSDRADGRKDTLRNILDTQEFVVNVVNETNVVVMNETATNFPEEVDEFAIAGVTSTPALLVKPPRVAEAPICFECTLHTSVPVGEGPGSATLVIGLIKHIYAHDDVINERGYINIDQLQPIGRLAGHGYCTIGRRFDLTRKTYQPD